MRDFTITIYRRLLQELKGAGYSFQTFYEFLVSPEKRVVVIRHDIDKRRKNSLQFAYLEHAFGVRTSYYFRILPKSFDPAIIDLIKGLGHEIGYHYEDLALARGNRVLAIELFRQHLAELRCYYPVKTICMHGSPLSKFDNHDLWNFYNYRDHEVAGEPYFDVNFSQVLYLTDTGRSWNKINTSLRDKVPAGFNLRFRSTAGILKNIDQLPDKVMFNFHPQWWDDSFLPWLRELIVQNLKNVVKKYFLVKKNAGE